MVALFTVLFVLICPLIIFVVLVQDPKGGGLAGVLGGAGGTSAFGAKTADVVMKTTVVLGMVFFLLALALGINLRDAGTGEITRLAPEAPVEAPAAAGTGVEGEDLEPTPQGESGLAGGAEAEGTAAEETSGPQEPDAGAEEGE